MKRKIHFLRFDTTRRNLYLPYMYFTFKRYYEVNGVHSNEWEWIPPEIDYADWTLDEIVDKSVEYNADVYAFTSYLWNWSVIKAVAKKIKERLPNAIMILGGPHQGTTYTSPMLWFKKYPYFDAACTPTEYGEWFITDCLDSISQGNLDWSKVRNSYHRLGLGPIPNKKLFEFPDGIMSTNLEESLRYTDYAKKYNKSITVLFETTRGCPYGCTYCEWSGGINAKVVDRDLKQIEDELSYFPIVEVESIYLTDANFGIMKNDPIKAEMLAGMKAYYKKFRVELSGLAKTGPEKRLAVLEPLFKSGALLSYQMSIQTGSREALKNVARTDLTVEENVEMARYLSKKYDATIHMEYILGLPGYTLKDFYEEYDAIYESASGLLANYGGVSRGPLLILPDSPAANPDYIQKYGLKLVPIGIEASDGEIGYDQIYNVILDSNFVDEPVLYIPVACNSYSVEDWKQMLFMGDMDHIFRISGMFELLVIYLYFRKGIKPSEIFRKIYVALKRISGLYNPAETYIDLITSGKLGKYDWRLMEAEKGFYANAYVCYLYLWAKHIDEIYLSLEKELDEYLDEQSRDCMQYLKSTTFRLDGEITWTSKWDWSTWEYLKEKVVEPDMKSMTYKTVAEPIDWFPNPENKIEALELDILQFRTRHSKILQDDGTYQPFKKFELKF